MPVATVDPGSYEKYELKTAPADPTDPEDVDGFVMLRPLPYGMKLTRRDKATKMMMKQQPTQNKRQAQESQTIELESYNEWAVAFDFAYCIGDHNLTDANKQRLDFTKPMSLKLLDPRVGSEIEKYINGLNEDEDEEMLLDFPTPLSTLSLTEEANLPQNGEKLSETAKVTPLET